MASLVAKFLPKYLGILFLGLLILGGNSEDVQANSSWKQLRGHSACGGVDQRGNLQEPCGFDRAKFESKAVGKCPKGSFFDIGTWACFSCPKGFNRNARPVTSPKACDKPIKGSATKAVYLGKVSCPSGAFLDPRNGGECWKCPSGYGRTAAAVNQWNACGMIGKKAVSAEFKGKACNAEGAFRDPRNGGECWKCPEDHLRTAAAVTAGNACHTNLDFEPATKTAALTCPAGQHFDFIDGGTCWSCPQDTTRSTSGVKSDKACRIKKMRWVVPVRGKYGLFGLGNGADDILAKLIAERTRIDAAAKAAAKASGEPEAQAIANTWKQIDSKPWESPILSALLGQIVMEAAVKPVAQRTASEKSLLDIVAKLIQWNRQFVAYQSKQAFDTYFAAANKANEIALSKMGAASIYAGGVIAPPDYNEIVAGAIQVGAAVAGPAGALLITLFASPVHAALLPHRALQAAKAAGDAAKVAAISTSWTGASAAMAAAAPMLIAAGAAVVVTMEMDKLMKTEEMEGKIRQAITIANRPVDIGLLLQMKEGPDEFLFHWAATIGGDAQPSTNFKTKLAAYKSGKTPGDLSSIDPSKITITSTTVPGQPNPNTTTIDPSSIKIEPIQSTTVVVGNTNAAPAPTAEKALIAAIKRQKTQPPGTLRFELTNAPGLCLSKSEGPTEAMALADCNQQDTLWIRPNEKPNALVFDSKYCVGVGDAKLQDRTKVLISKCQNSPNMQWELQADGHVKMVKFDFCMTVIDKAVKGAEVLLQKCSGNRPRQIWRPWTAAQ
ncbi:ricin-type beta-trefoil lectin domain protein [bacterium SCSIO 12827]|nr:ricin-type beta-trefoil lectin domain protein [bacterium SCSIO 12827]